MNRIAVLCQTKKEWEAVQAKGETNSIMTWKTATGYDEPMCLYVDGGTCDKRQHCERNGYKIISAQEYLNEGGKDVSEFKVGDRVECINNEGSFASRHLNLGIIYTIRKTVDAGNRIELKETSAITPNISRFKLITKTQTTKENNMNVNSTVAKVFKNVDDAILVTKYLGKEYEEGNHRAYLDLKANDKVVLAEAKRLEKEEKEDK